VGVQVMVSFEPPFHPAQGDADAAKRWPGRRERCSSGRSGTGPIGPGFI